MGESSEELFVTIAEAASDALETPITELPPLYHSIAIDGLDKIVNAEQSRDVTVTFPYAGLRVLVHSDKTVYVRPLRDGNTDSPHEASFDD